MKSRERERKKVFAIQIFSQGPWYSVGFERRITISDKNWILAFDINSLCLVRHSWKNDKKSYSRTSGEVCITDAFPIVALPLTLKFLSFYGYLPLSPLNLQTATSLIFWKWWSFQNQQGPFDLVKWMFSRGWGRA